MIRHTEVTGLCLRASSHTLTWTIDKWLGKKPWRMVIGNTAYVAYEEAVRIAKGLIKAKAVGRKKHIILIDPYDFEEKFYGDSKSLKATIRQQETEKKLENIKRLVAGEEIAIPTGQITLNQPKTRIQPLTPTPVLPTLNDLFPRYAAGKEIKTSSISQYMSSLRNALKPFADRPYDTVTLPELEDALSKASPGTHSVALALLSGLCDFGYAHYNVKNDVVERYYSTHKVKKPERREEYIPLEKIPEFINEVMQLKGRTIRQHLLVLLFTGCRHASAKLIKDNDEFIHVFEPKGRKGINSTPLKIDSVLPSKIKVMKIEYSKLPINIDDDYAKWLRENWKITPHGLRHTYKTWLGYLGVSAQEQERLMGRSCGIAGRYYHGDPLSLRDTRRRMDEFLADIEFDWKN